MISSPLVSIIVPCYNQAGYLNESLDSILSQTYTNWECIIINDGSTDTTEIIALDYCNKEGKFKYIKKENAGLSAARNTGIKTAKGSWIQFLDADDYIVPDKLELSIVEINKQPLTSVVVSNFKLFIDDYLNTTPPYTPLKQEYLDFENLLFGWNADFIIPIHSALFKAELFNENLFDEKLKSNEDWIMWLNIFINKPNAVYLDNTFAYYRINPTSMTKDKIFVHDNLVIAYKEIINYLPGEYLKKFSCMIIDRLNYMVKHRDEEVKILKTKISYKIWEKTLNLSRRLLKKIL